MPETPTSTTSTLKPTLGLTGLTSNAMALIAPGAFLWLTFGPQVLTGAPGAGMSMWVGIVAALLLCLATAVAYAELSKLYPGAGSSYFFAEQAFLSKHGAFKWARVAKFVVGWASHLYYWVYPGVMVGVTALLVGYLLGEVFPSTFSAGYPSPIFMFGFSIIFAFGVSYIAFRGVGGTTGVNAAINVVQITALIIFATMAICHRASHPEGSVAYVLDSTGTPVNYIQDTVPDTSKTIADPKDASKQIQDPNATLPKVDPSGASVPVYIAVDASGAQMKGADGNPFVIPTDKDGKLPATLPAGAAKAIPEPFTVSYKGGITKDDKTGIETYNYHESAASVVAPHKFSYVIIQACVAILILVGFESVSSMGEEAKNPKKDIPKAIILSLLIQGGFCYLLEYFAANYYLHSGYGATANASSSSAPLGDMMQLIGAWAFGSPRAGYAFMMVQAFTVFLALIGTTLSCLSTGARVTYAMGRDEEVGSHFGLLHGKNLTPHRAIWTLATLSAVIGCLTVATYYCGPAVSGLTKDAYNSTVQGLPHNFWYSIGTHKLSYETACSIPQSLLLITLVSNFGTFLLYMMSCLIAIVAFHEHHLHNFFLHKFIPMFGLLANLLCMAFYLVGPFFVSGMSPKEPYIALGVAAVWGAWGLVYFARKSKASGKEIFLTQKPATS
ncbi:MAG TPA: APC family permease [Opitutaceae bacterium]|nr:APC family permease [Opitutaceae bacterium]